MKVLLVGNYALDQQRSMLGFAEALRSGLIQKGLNVRVVAPQALAARLLPSRSASNGVRKWLGYFDKFVLFPIALRRAAKWADIVHICDQGNAMYVKHLSRKSQIVTCHDLLAMQASRGEFSGWVVGKSGQKFQQLILSGLKQACYIVCDSQHTLNELHRIAPLTLDKTHVIYIGFISSFAALAPSQSRSMLESLGLGDQSFLLHVGGNQPYKNRLRVLEIFHALRKTHGRPELKLVMAGKSWTEKMRAFVVTHNLQKDVIELVDLKNEGINALYSNAKALIFPSSAEGFGLPIIEAQACHCPVFTTNRAPMNEVGGEGAFYFDPDDVESAAQIIHDNLDDTENIVQKGVENIARFSTEKMLDSYIEVYKQVLRDTSSTRTT